MPWQITLSISILAGVTTALIQRSFSTRTKLPHSFAPAIMYLFGVWPLGLIVGLSMHHHIRWNSWVIFLLLLVGFFGALYNWFAFKAVSRLPVIQYQTIYQAYQVMTVILGWSLLNEGLTLMQAIGAGLLLCSALIAIRAPAANRVREKKVIRKSAIILTLLSAACLATTLVAEKALLGHMDTGAYLIFGYGAQALGLTVLASTSLRKGFITAGKGEVKKILIMGWTLAVSGTFYVISLVGSNNVSLVTALCAIGLPLTVLGAYIFLGERENIKTLWAALAIGFLGLIAMSL